MSAAVEEDAPETVRTAVLHGIRDIRIEERAPPPAPMPTDLILRPESVGICGSDFSYYCKCSIGGVDFTFQHELPRADLVDGNGLRCERGHKHTQKHGSDQMTCCMHALACRPTCL